MSWFFISVHLNTPVGVMVQNYNTSLKLGIEEKYSGKVGGGSDWFLNLALENSKKDGSLTAGTKTEGEKKEAEIKMRLLVSEKLLPRASASSLIMTSFKLQHQSICPCTFRKCFLRCKENAVPANHIIPGDSSMLDSQQSTERGICH